VSRDDHLRVCLERTVELEAVRLRLRDWPGLNGPLVHVPDPVSPDDQVVGALAARLAPRFRVLSLEPRAEFGYQVDTADLLGMLDQFGFEAAVLVGERLGGLTALLVAAWHPDYVGRLILIDPTCEAPPIECVAAHALRDCPPDWASLQQAIRCPVLELAWDASAPQRVEEFLRR
jgi:pimeloyl-ACP methyl ester carboxylesterase